MPVKEISDLLGRLPETFGFLGPVKKGGMMAVRGEKGGWWGERRRGQAHLGCKMPLISHDVRYIPF